MAAQVSYDDDLDRPGGWELVTLVTLVVAGIGLPVLGWVVGMIMVGLSEVWTRQDKLIALIVPLVVVLGVVVATAFAGDTGTLLLDLGPLAVLVILGGGIAGVVAALYLTWRAFELA